MLLLLLKMSSIKSLNTKLTLLERKINVGNYGGINVGGGLLEVDVSNSKVNTNSSRVSFGESAGSFNQGSNSIAIGHQAGQTTQGGDSIAIGTRAGNYSQGINAVSIGYYAGDCNQGISAVAIGENTAYLDQQPYTVAVGAYAGGFIQGTASVAIGYGAGSFNQGSNSIAIGSSAGYEYQGDRAIAIGLNAGFSNQGTNSIAIGSFAGHSSQSEFSIVIDASATISNTLSITQQGFYVRPIRDVNDATLSCLTYDTNSREIVRNTNGAKTFVIPHPLCENKYLVHACLEGPEAGVYYRGKGEIKENENSVVIELPEYVDKLATDLTVHVTSHSKVQLWASEVENNKFFVEKFNCTNECKLTKFSWIVYGKRQDIYTEPFISDVSIKGQGPYTYIQ